MSLRASLPFVGRGQTIGIYGGSFDPPHAGHLHVAKLACRTLDLDQIWWLVSPGNPLKSQGPFQGWQSRARGAGKLIGQHPRMKIITFEAELGLHYSAKTLTALKIRLPHARLILIMGADNWRHFHLWQDWRAMMASAPVAVIDRPGQSLPTLASFASQTFASSRVPMKAAAELATRPLPAWTFITGRKHPLSSTEIRNKKLSALDL